jgi:CRISPR/Cas system-associated protein Csm6
VTYERERRLHAALGLERERCEQLEAELEAARRVADAAVAYDHAKTDYDVDEAYGRLTASVVEKMLISHGEMRKAVREYRAAVADEREEEK